MVFWKLIKKYSPLEQQVFMKLENVPRFMMLHKTHGRIYLICQKIVVMFHVLEYRIKFLLAVVNLD